MHLSFCWFIVPMLIGSKLDLWNCFMLLFSNEFTDNLKVSPSSCSTSQTPYLLSLHYSQSTLADSEDGKYDGSSFELIYYTRLYYNKFDIVEQMEVQVKVKKTARVFTGVPEQYYNNKLLNDAISILPAHYNFQIPKTIYRIDVLKKQLNKEILNVSLQFPEGLMLFGCIICDIIKTFTNSNTVILGDVTYGACCIDDIASDQLNCDLLVHYGHSCLVPITQTKRKVLYIFVEIDIDTDNFVQTIIQNFPDKQQPYYIMGTIQFNSALYQTKQRLMGQGYHEIIIPQEKPRSSGQILGCTSPSLPEGKKNIIIFLCDGRFHMEAAMIANPHYTFYQYDPYSRQITEQKYDNALMRKRRMEEIARAIGTSENRRVCFILGTLGRQGNPAILNRLIQKISGKFQYMILLASQINAQLLEDLDVDFVVQIACPRLSIDWSYGTPKPLLTPYQLFALIDRVDLREQYSMDFYSYQGGEWSNLFGKAPVKRCKKGQKEKPKTALKMDKQ